MSEREELEALRAQLGNGERAELEELRAQFGTSASKSEAQDQPSILGAIPTGVNSLVPSLAGLPMDTATSLANLGIAGYGAAKGAMGGTDLPELLPPQIGGSKWIAEKLNKGAKVLDPDARDLFANPRPDSAAAQMLHTGAAVASGGLLSPATSVKTAATNVAKMLPSATGAAVGQQVSDNPLASVLGAVAPLGVRSAIPKTRPVVRPEAIMEAKSAGYRIPPTQAKSSAGNSALEGFAGKAATAQKASIHNQRVTNDLAVKSLGLPKGTQITSEVLRGVRESAGKAYDKLSNIGELKTDSTFHKHLSKITGKGTAAVKEFPGLMDKGVSKIVSEFRKKTISSEAAVGAIKELRFQSGKNNISLDPKAKALGKAQKKIADSLEGLLERNSPKELLPEFRSARQTIAKTYTVEKALNDATGNVSTRALSRELSKGKPLSGDLATAGRFGGAFPKAAQDMTFSAPGINPLDYAAAAAASLGTGNPGWLAALTGRPLARSVILSKPYQALNVNPPKPRPPIDPQRHALAVLLAQQAERASARGR